MNQQEIRDLRKLMDYEGSRNGPPIGFPKFPHLPAGRYNDVRFQELEKQHVWRKSWLLAGHIDEIPEPGCYKLWETSGQPVVIIHSRSGAINAFYNTCSHRGAPVVQEASGKRARLSCKYHGWTYDDEGKLVSVRDPRDFVDLDFSCRSLRSVRCERFGNLIFVNFDADAPALKEWLGSIAGEWDEFRFDQVRLVDHYVWDLNSNWKIAMEANMEVYHVKSIHPATVDLLLDSDKNVNTIYPYGHGRDGGAFARNGGAGETISQRHAGDRHPDCRRNRANLHAILRHVSELGFAAGFLWLSGAAVLAQWSRQVPASKSGGSVPIGAMAKNPRIGMVISPPSTKC